MVPERKSTRLTQRSWISLVLALLWVGMSVVDFFGSSHDTALRKSIVIFWIVTALTFVYVLLPGLRHGLPGTRDALNRHTRLRPMEGENADRVMLTVLIVGMVAATAYCVWLAYRA